MNESRESILSGREKLKSLEAEGKYVFHGSENPDIDEMEPRQGYNHKPDGTKVEDGEPAVFASDRVDYAIMMALINKKNCPDGYRSSAKSILRQNGDVDLILGASQSSIDQLKDDSVGYVYVFDKDAFIQRPRKTEYISTEPVTHVDKVVVTKNDLPKDLQIVNNEVETKENLPFPKIATELVEMVRVDQEMRKKSHSDDDFWDATVDHKNTERMKEIIAEIGWPTRSKVGSEGMKNAWLLVQHADHDIAFQKECLELMRAENPDEVGKRNMAYLTDRVLVNEGMPQLYGSQFTGTSGEFVPRPIEDVENVDERRIEMGMGTLKEGIEEMNSKYL